MDGKLKSALHMHATVSLELIFLEVKISNSFVISTLLMQNIFLSREREQVSRFLNNAISAAVSCMHTFNRKPI
jgi:hypothetical protein